MSNFKLQLGINHCSNKEYHSDKSYLSSSQLKTLLENPAQFYSDHVLGQKINEQKPQYDFGSLVHTLVLEPHMLDKEFVVFPGMRKQGAEWQKFKTEHEPSGKILLNASQMHNGLQAQKALKHRPELLELLQNGEPELSICQIVNGVAVKKRSDFISTQNGYILDVKTTSYGAGAEQFKQTIDALHYGFSAGQYVAIAEQFYGQKFEFYWAVYSKSDLVWDVYKCSPTRLQTGREDFFKSLEMYKQCLASGVWANLESTETQEKEKTQTYEVEEI